MCSQTQPEISQVIVKKHEALDTNDERDYYSIH